ncbi:MAG: uracil-DNA glycosylase family protein [Candidatus Gracilibacteria bacterium]|nr:uracil-DNA glycosylase family protein [Candidatus Gracilibacteria bacterium]MDQ7023066.1 uracil-DNA glycosylase family protein [Candidatus Gracilibacteria bacterium]
MNLEKLEQEMKSCKKCSDILLKYNIMPKPIFGGKQNCKIMLLGQAPGISEYESGKPFKGGTGKSIKQLFSDCGLEDFDKNVYQTSVVKCFPGRKEGLSTDRKPSKIEIQNCSSFLIKQIEFIKPEIIVCLGMVSWKSIIELKEKEEPHFIKNFFGEDLSKLKVKHIVGRTFNYKNSKIIPLIHPSGAANGARSLNKIEHEKSIKILKENLKIN